MYDDMQGVNRSSRGRMLSCSLEPGNEARESEGNVSQSQIDTCTLQYDAENEWQKTHIQGNLMTTEIHWQTQLYHSKWSPSPPPPHMP